MHATGFPPSRSPECSRPVSARRSGALRCRACHRRRHNVRGVALACDRRSDRSDRIHEWSSGSYNIDCHGFGRGHEAKCDISNWEGQILHKEDLQRKIMGQD
jgi:hypothetical protein